MYSVKVCTTMRLAIYYWTPRSPLGSPSGEGGTLKSRVIGEISKHQQVPTISLDACQAVSRSQTLTQLR